MTIEACARSFQGLLALDQPEELKCLLQTVSCCLERVSGDGKKCTESLVAAIQIAEQAFTVCQQQ